ncbi:MAG TPA: universal stress protein [bacterium]|nr:universal stress protein [bacterium]
MRILLATDGSPHALRAATFLERLARQAGEVELIVVNVGYIPAAAYSGLGAAVAVDLAGLEDDLELAGQKILETTVRELGAIDARVTKEYRCGDPASEILSVAAAKNVDLIVMGCRGLTPLAGLILGSVSERVLHRAHVPVLIVR